MDCQQPERVRRRICDRFSHGGLLFHFERIQSPYFALLCSTRGFRVLLGLLAWLPGTHPLACRLPSRLSFPSHRGERLVGSKVKIGHCPDVLLVALVSSFTEANIGSMGIFAPLELLLLDSS